VDAYPHPILQLDIRTHFFGLPFALDWFPTPGPDFSIRRVSRDIVLVSTEAWEAKMGKEDCGNSFDRRVFLGASTATLLGLSGVSLAQQQRPSEPHVGSEPATRAPSQAIADFAIGFDLKSALGSHSSTLSG
jgi:hypothetical protein